MNRDDAPVTQRQLQVGCLSVVAAIVALVLVIGALAIVGDVITSAWSH